MNASSMHRQPSPRPFAKGRQRNPLGTAHTAVLQRCSWNALPTSPEFQFPWESRESDLKVIWKWSVSFTIQHHPTSTFIIQWFNINIQTFETRPSQQNSHPTAYEAWNTGRHPSEWIGGARGTRYTLGHPGVLASETWRNRAGKKKRIFEATWSTYVVNQWSKLKW